MGGAGGGALNGNDNDVCLLSCLSPFPAERNACCYTNYKQFWQWRPADLSTCARWSVGRYTCSVSLHRHRTESFGTLSGVKSAIRYHTMQEVNVRGLKSWVCYQLNLTHETAADTRQCLHSHKRLTLDGLLLWCTGAGNKPGGVQHRKGSGERGRRVGSWWDLSDAVVLERQRQDRRTGRVSQAGGSVCWQWSRLHHLRGTSSCLWTYSVNCRYK